MATDIAFAKELAETLDVAYTGKIQRVVFSFDAYRQSEDINAVAWAVISPATLTEERMAHDVWGSNFALLITMMVKQAINSSGADDFIDDYLTSFDMMLDMLKADPKTSAIDREVRYDLDQIQTRGMVLAQAVCTFNIFD